MIQEFALTTVDNPFDPFEDFLHWFAFDNEKGYNSLSYLARIAANKLDDSMSAKEECEAVSDAIDEIIQYNPLGIYKKVSRKNINNAAPAPE